MPVIPTYQDKEPLDPNTRGMPHPTFSTAREGQQIANAQAMSRMGSAISQAGSEFDAQAKAAKAEEDRIAQHAMQQQEQKLKFSAGVQDDARRQELNGYLQQAKEKMPEDGAGFHDSFLESADAIAEKRFAGMDPSVAQPYREKWQAERIGWSNQAAQLEAARGKQFATGKIGELQDGLRQEIVANPTPEAADAAYQRGVERIKEAPFISPAEKGAMLKQWEADARTVEAQTRFANKPEEARQALGVPLAGDGAAPVKQGAAVNGAMSFFMSKGWTKEQAAGIVGNLFHESGGKMKTNARAPGDGRDGSDSIGIAQWNAERATALKAFAAAQGKPWTDYETQLAFVDKELRSSHSSAGEALKNAKTADEAAGVIVTRYEMPKGSNRGAESSLGWKSRVGAASLCWPVSRWRRCRPAHGGRCRA
jgi:hypothetical protein